MKRISILKRSISALLCAIMVCSMLSVGAVATDEAAGEDYTHAQPVMQSNKEGYWSYTGIPVEGGATYYSEGANRMWFYDENKEPISTYNAYKDSEVPFRFTVPETAAYLGVTYSPNLVDWGTEKLEKVGENPALVPLFREIPIENGQLMTDGTVTENAVYGCVRDYALGKGHTLSISSAEHVFSVRQFVNGDYATALKVPATAAGYTAGKDMTVGCLIRRPDSSELAEGELDGIRLIDSLYGMVGVDGFVHRFTVEAETIDGGTATTRAAIFLPDSYSESGDPTRLIVMTNGYSAYLTDGVWNGNTADNVGVIRNYLDAGYAVWVVNNTANRTVQTPDLGCPQLVSSYLEAYEYIQEHFHVEEKFSIHSRSFGTFAAVRLMLERPELVKCALMTGPRVSFKLAWSGVDKAFVADRFGFADTTGATYEADKMAGHDPYTDVNGERYALPPTCWIMCEGDGTVEPREFLEKLKGHGNDVTAVTYIDTTHTGVCTLNEARMMTPALEYLEEYQDGQAGQPHEHSYNQTVTPPTCTEQGYTTHTCTLCGESYVDGYTEKIWHRYADGVCTECGCDMIRVSAEEMAQLQGGVDAGSGGLNTTFTNNWYANIQIPEGAQQVRVQTFKTYGNWGCAFLNGSTYISGYSDKALGGQWVTLDIPEEADVFRYGYLYDAVAQQNGYPVFEYVEFSGEKMTPVILPQPPQRPVTGCHSFSVEVNIAPIIGGAQEYVMGTDYGYIMLPTNYSAEGDPTRLIIVCHGAGATLSRYQSDAWVTNNYSFWTDLGYAVMDMFACPPQLSGDNSELHYGNPLVLECYKKGYDYVMEHFNLRQDGVFVIGSSMGGLSSFQIVQSGLFPVLAQVGYCPAIDLFKQAYCNPWASSIYQRSRIASYFGFEGTKPVFTSSKYPSDDEIRYFEENQDKVSDYSPIVNAVTSGDPSVLFDVIPTSATAVNVPEEEALYARLTAAHPCPILIFHNEDDGVVSYRYSKYFVEMVQRSGQNALLHTFSSGGHNAWDNGQTTVVEGINGPLTLSVSKAKAYEFFKAYDLHEEHQEWIDPAVAATCTQSGLTQGSHCAVCGEVIVKQEEIPALGHSFVPAVENGKLYEVCACGEKQEVCFLTMEGNTLSVTLKYELQPTMVYAARYENGILTEVRIKEVTQEVTTVEFTGSTGDIKVFFLTDNYVPWLSAKTL